MSRLTLNILCLNTAKRLFGIVIFVMLIVGNPCKGQKQRVNFQSIKHGLSNPYVKSILKDSMGFMWFGTHEGLNKFDGSNFKLYVNNIKDSTSLINNTINAIYEDKNHKLWIGTSVGVSIYNREKDNFEVFKGIGSEQFSYITSFGEDSNGNIWIGTSGQGLYVFNPFTDSLNNYSHDENNPSSLSSNFIQYIISDNKNRIWFATRHGVELFDAEKEKFIHFKSSDKLYPELQNSHVRRLCFDKIGNLWAGTYGKGLFKIIEKDNDFQIFHYAASDQTGNLSSNDILSLTIDDQGNMWVGTENGGLNILPVGSDKFQVYKTEDGSLYNISSNSIWSLYQDNIGILWIGTYNHGINFIDKRIEKFEVYQRNPFDLKTLTNDNVVSFSEDHNGNLWIATDGGGVSTFNMHSRKFTNIIDNSLITSKATMDILCDSKQMIWVATWAGGIELFDITGKKIKNFRLEAHNRPGNIFCLMEDNNGDIWAGTSRNGLFKYDSKSNSFKKIVDKSGKTQLSEDAYVITLFQDSENTIWVGVSFSLIKIKNTNGKQTFTAYIHSNNPESLSSFNISTIYEDSKNNLWVGTDDGLNLLNKNNGTFSVFRKEDGLPNNTINGILEDDNYCLWLSTHGGISKFDIEKKTFKNFTIDDGLLSNSFNPRSCLKTNTGEFFFGNNSGFLSFFPDSIKNNTYIPPVYLTGFKIFNHPAVIGAEDSPLKKSISETKKITLNHKQTSFMIEFVALNFTHAAKNQYKYMLEGFDEDWINSGTKQYATYTNIDAGKYIFKVKGSNNEGIWNPQPVELEIKVLPPYWKSKLAYLFYSICIILILWGFIKLLIIRSNQAEKLRLEKIQRQKSEELNRMKIQFFANISHEFRTPLSLIIAPLKEIIEKETLKDKVKSSLQMVFRNANKLFELINELMDFTKSEEGRLKMKVQQSDLISFAKDVYSMFIDEARRRNIHYRFEPSVETLDLWFDKRKMEKIIGNLLSNAFKYTQDQGSIAVKISTEITDNHPFAKVSIIDDGSGISAENLNKVFDRFYQSPEEDNKNVTGTGIGLALVKGLVELHSGIISVSSQKWKETCFTFKIPLGNEHFNKNEILDETGEYFVGHDNKQPEKSNTENVHTEDSAPILLIVEDNLELKDYLASILSSNYKVLTASNGIEGLKVSRKSIPDLIVSDIAMPHLSGIELCRTIKNEMPTSHIPVILLTSKSSTSDIVEGIGTGADAYITKPFDIEHLKITIEKTIETRRKLYQIFSQDTFIIPKKNSENKLDKIFIEKIIQYIDQNASNNFITVENLAAHLFMSRTNVYRKIKAITGKTATEFIRSIRLKMALKLLESGQYNVSEIAFNVGFSSPGYFTKCFRDQYGKSPSEYLVGKKN